MADFYDGPLPPKAIEGHALPDWPDFITSFQDISLDPPGNNKKWTEQHLTIVRMACAILGKDKKSLTDQTRNIFESEVPNLGQELIEHLNYSRLVLCGYQFMTEWALCRLSIVLGRNVLDDLPD